MKRSYALFTIITVLFMFSTYLFADRVELMNGNIISGTIQLEDDDKIIIENQTGIEQSIPKSIIKAIVRDQTPSFDNLRKVNVLLKNNRTIKGYLVNEDATHIYLMNENDIETKIDKSMVNSVSYDFGQNSDNSFITQNNINEPQNRAQYKSINKKNGDWDFDFGAKIGYFSPGEKAIDEMYGSGLVYGGEFIMWNKNSLGVSFGIERFGAKGDPIVIDLYDFKKRAKDSLDAECSISIMPITLTGLYRIKNPTLDIIPYFGLGGGLYFVKEEVKVSYYGESASASGSDNALGFHLTAGIQYENFFAEAKYSSASISSAGAAGNSANIGGFNIFLGIRL